jgi:hypothetical protein
LVLFAENINKIGSKSNQIMNQLNQIKNKTTCSKFDFFFLFQPELDEVKKNRFLRIKTKPFSSKLLNSKRG